MKKSISAFFVIIFIVLIGFGDFSLVGSQSETEIQKAAAYLKSQEQTPWITMALAGAGEAGLDLNYLSSVPEEQKSVTAYSKYILALTSAGKNPATFGDENYIEKLKSYFQEGQFGDENLINDDIWAVLALGSIGQENLLTAQTAKDYILNAQNPDGGWGYAVSADSDSNDTASAVMALLEAGVALDADAITRAVDYLKSIQNNDGGFPYNPNADWGKASDSASDSWVISAIYKLKENPENWKKNGYSPIEHLKSLQDEDGGFWWLEQGDNKMNTAWAVIALSGKYFPVYTDYNKHFLRIEGTSSTISQGFVNGATPLDLVINASKISGFSYEIVEYAFGLYLKAIQGEEDAWMYMVNNALPQVGAGDYYLMPDDEVLFFFGDWSASVWQATEVEVSKTQDLVKIQVKYFNSSTTDWQNLEIPDLVVKIDIVEFLTNDKGIVEISLASLQDGFYSVFAETQIIDGKGYIRSEKQGLKIGGVPIEHTVGLRANIEQIAVPPGGGQTGISFSIEPSIVDFGSLKPGESSEQSLTVVNGDTNIYLEADVSGAGVFRDNLSIAEKFWQSFSDEMEPGQNKALSVKLNVPSSYQGDFGAVEGELTFWAIKPITQ